MPLPKIKSQQEVAAMVGSSKAAGRDAAADDDPLGAKRDALRGLPSIVGKLVELGSQIDEIKSPLARAAAQSYFEGAYSEALGFQIQIPSAGELENKELQRRAQRAQLLKDVAQNDLRQARAFIMDNPDVKKIGDPAEIMKDPDQMIGVLNQMGITSITRGTFELAGDEEGKLSKEDVKRNKAKEVAGDLQRESQALLDIQQIGKREPALDPIIEEMLGSAEKASGATLTGRGDHGNAGIFSDIDEDRGSAAALAAYDGIRRVLGPELSRSTARRFLSVIGEDIATNLSDLPTNAKGELIVGQGDSGVTPAATVNMGMLVLMLSKDMGVSVTDTMKMLKLPYSGIDIDSMKAGQQALAQQFGEVRGKVSGALGLQE